MNRRDLTLSLAASIAGVAAIAVACNANDYPGLGPIAFFDGGYSAAPPGGNSGGGSVLDSSIPVDVRRVDVIVTTDGPKPADAPPAKDAAGPCLGCTLIYDVTTPGPFSVALDAANVYFTLGTTAGAGMGAVWSVPRGGGSKTIVYGGDTGPEIVKVFPGTPSIVAWSSIEMGPGTGTIWVESVGTPEAPATTLTAPYGVAVDANNVYWVSSGGGGAQVQYASVMSGTPLPLGTAAGGFTPQGIAVSGGSVYFAAYLPSGGGGLFELPVTDAGPVAPVEIWTGDSTSQPQDVAVDTLNVYWTDPGDGNAYSMPLGGGVVTTLASKAMGVTAPTFLAVDAVNVYFSDTAGMALYEVSTGGGPLKTLVASSAGVTPAGVAADGNDVYVYFATATQILSIPK